MFATPIPDLGQGLFTAASLMIVVPSGVQIFCWLATLWTGRPYITTPLLYVLGFFWVFVLGGLTGVILASVSIDLQVHDTMFVVAHLHYVLIGGAVFPLIGALHYWFPKFTGRMPDESLGRLSFWLLFAGFNLTFFPLHLLGLYGMTRRVYTYNPETGWGHLNFVATVGAFLLALGVLAFVINVFWSRKRGVVAGPNPWGAGTLEWWTSSPPPNYNFAYPPTVQSDEPVWENRPDAAVVTGLSTTKREVLCTTILDAIPDHRYDMAGNSIWPPLVAWSVGFALIGGMFTPWAPVIAAVLLTAFLFAWFWVSGLRTSKGKPMPSAAEGGVA
jgi:cytochrome c oxidase subunit 1